MKIAMLIEKNLDGILFELCVCVCVCVFYLNFFKKIFLFKFIIEILLKHVICKYKAVIAALCVSNIKSLLIFNLLTPK